MDQSVKTKYLFKVICPRLNKVVILYEHTWREHILPEHPEVSNYLRLIQGTIEKSDEQQDIWVKVKNQNKLCIVKRIPNFLPYNNYILVGLKICSDEMACVTSVYPVNELPPVGMKRL